MKLEELLENIVEKYVGAIKKSNSLIPIYKNPTMEELNNTAHYGIVRCIVTTDSVYIFDGDRAEYKDFHIKGLHCTIFMKNSNNIKIQVAPYSTNLSEDEIRKIISNNEYLKNFIIHDISTETDNYK